MNNELIEKLSRMVHDDLRERMSHVDMVSYDKVPEDLKQYNRDNISSVLRALDNLGIKLDNAATKKVNGNHNSNHIFEMVRLEIISPLEARDILQVDSLFPDTHPICPDCKQVMVKTHIELENKSGWFSGWGCGCRYEPKS